MDAAGALFKIQTELEAVKEKLMADGTHLGMKGETLQRYLLQLNEKENLLLSRQIKGMPGETKADENASPAAALAPDVVHLAVTPVAAPEPPAAEPPAAEPPAAEPPAAEPANGQRCGSSEPAGPPSPASRLKPRDPPEGDVAPFDKEDPASVRTHMCAYEAIPLESAKALRALASLSYAKSKAVGEDEQIVEQLLRLCAIHPDVEKVQLGAVRSLCNLAYEVAVARSRLTDPSILAVLVGAMAAFPNSKDIGTRASEAVARIVLSETQLEGEGTASTPSPASPVEGPGALGGLFTATMAGDASWHRVVYELISQLLANEVIDPCLLAQRFTGAAAISGEGAVATALGWLALARHFSASAEVQQLPDALVGAGAIGVATQLMEANASEAAVQLAGIEALSSLVGNRYHGLHLFAEAQGIARFCAAMRAHGGDATLQLKAVRALVCAVNWPEDVHQKSGYDLHSAVALTKSAMSQHVEDVELQRATLEALAKYLERTKCVEEVKAEGGEGMIKAVMIRHRDEDRVQTWGREVLDALGSAAPQTCRSGQ